MVPIKMKVSQHHGMENQTITPEGESRVEHKCCHQLAQEADFIIIKILPTLFVK